MSALKEVLKSVNGIAEIPIIRLTNREKVKLKTLRGKKRT